MIPEAEDPRIGQTLGRYRIEKRLGRGGMGVVYQGHQLSLNRPVAIKVLPPQMAADADFRERFRREAHAVASLTHENIVHIYDIEEAEGAYFLVMELVDGKTLRKLRETRRFSAEEIRSIGVALTRALACAHRHGIIHRDVKSQNVMVAAGGTVKLMDFGIAWTADSGVKTATGHVLGTPEVMAPEQALTGTATARSDLYSLGVLLFELATGRLPFSGAEPFAIAYQHIHEPVPRPRTIDPAVPPWLEGVILKALEKNPDHRFASAQEMEQALLGAPVKTTAVEAGPPLAAAPTIDTTAPTVLTPTAITRGTYGPVRWPRGPRPWLLGGTLLIVGLGLAAWLLGRPAGEVHDRAPEVAAATAPEPAPRPVAAASEGPAEGPTKRPPAAKPAAEPVAGPAPAAATAVESAPAPPKPPPELPVSAVLRCRNDVDFDVSPEEAVVVIDGVAIGTADDWDGSGGAPTWHPSQAVSRACFRLEGYQSICLRIVLDPQAKEATCQVDTELEELEEP